MCEYSLVTSDLVDYGREFPAQTNTLVNGCNWVIKLVSCFLLVLLCSVFCFSRVLCSYLFSSSSSCVCELHINLRRRSEAWCLLHTYHAILDRSRVVVVLLVSFFASVSPSELRTHKRRFSSIAIASILRRFGVFLCVCRVF